MSQFTYIEQGSDEWLELRKGKITASACAALVNQGKYLPRTYREYWMWRKGLLDIPPLDPKYAEYGHFHEPLAMNRLNEITGLNMVPACVINGDLMASMDGWDADNLALGEVKCPQKGKKSKTWKHVAEHGTVPPWYWPQVVMGAFLAGANQAHFLVYDGESSDDLHVAVSTNETTAHWHDEIMPAIESFRMDFEQDIAPGELIDPKLIEKVRRLRVLKVLQAQTEEEQKELKAELAEASGGEDSWCDGASIKWVGGTRFDKKAAAKDGVPISKYEKPSKPSARITV